MKHQKILRLFLVMLVAAVLTFGVLQVVGRASAAEGNTPAPFSVRVHTPYTLLIANGVTTTAGGIGAGYRLGGFDYADCFGSFTIASAQSLVLGLQSSADNVAWAPVVSLTAVTATGVNFTRTAVYGEYFRAVISQTWANAYTATVKCTLKN